jgi:hypothetical protein
MPAWRRASTTRWPAWRGLLAIAIFGVVWPTFDVNQRASRLSGLTPSVRTAVDRELPKMAGAELDAVPTGPHESSTIRSAIDDAFVAAFRLVMLSGAALAAAAAACGAGLSRQSPNRPKETGVACRRDC